MRLTEASKLLTPDKRYWQRILQQVSTGLFVLNHVVGGGFALSFPTYLTITTQEPSKDYPYFFPIIFTPPAGIPDNPPADIRDNPYCQQQFPEASDYLLNAQELAIEQLLLADPGQKHAQLEYSVALSQAARRRAQDMADRAYFSHTNPDGYGSNCIVLQQQFVLPDGYDFSRAANNVETIAAGYSNMHDAWNGLLSSERHAAHLLGHGEFYGAQRYYGIGYVAVPGSEYGHYLVIIIADQKQN